MARWKIAFHSLTNDMGERRQDLTQFLDGLLGAILAPEGKSRVDEQ